MSAIRYNSLIELIRMLPDEQSCIAYLEELRWGKTVVSPYDETSKVYKTKRGYRCANTGKDFNVLTGTIMQGTKVKLIKWIMAMWLLNSEKKGLSSHNLARKIGVCQNTAWYMLHRLRMAYEQEDVQLTGEIEMDETFVGGKNKNRHRDKKVPKSTGRAHIDKTPVWGAIERGGRLVAKAIPDTSQKSITPLVLAHISRTATIYTDEWQGYDIVGKLYHREFVDHGRGQYASGNVTTNRIEGFWSIFKRGIIGVYHRASRKHLQHYADEFVYRFNTRNLTESERFYDFLTRTDKRITYKELVNI